MNSYRIGLDIGSTTVKVAVLDCENHIIYHKYKRHLSDIKSSIIDLMYDLYKTLGNISCSLCITGSGGLSVSKWLGIQFEQEVIACTKAIKEMIPETEVAIELGGEDAKITYLKNGMEQRMNGSCAGGTGAFIDQMATLLNTDAKGLNTLAKDYKVIYPIASRCGVFAKTDIQPLLNDGARKEDIAASIFQAVVNQTIGGLACGKPIKGKVALLGGPLYFLSELRYRFKESLNLRKEELIAPENSQLFPGIGAALLSDEEKSYSLKTLVEQVKEITNIKDEDVKRLAPLFKNQEEYQEFKNRHKKNLVKRKSLKDYKGRAYLGIDAGSTTTKVVLISENGEILYSHYNSNHGEPLETVVEVLKDLYKNLSKETSIAYSTVTGYGESLIKAALHVDVGEIETIAHYKAADYFLPGVDFILDIGGQDMKCLRIKNKTIDNILLNEACSSGCGSFIEGFATSLGLSAQEFAKKAIDSQEPVDLGSKCTVFMNSRVKQAQKEGATVADLSAGLSYSVIKNALYKVIKLRDEKELGEKIIVQGGTFYNDSVLRSFELISGREVIRPEIAGLMGAFGAALIAREHFYDKSLHKDEAEKMTTSTLISLKDLENFDVRKSFHRCKRCGNNCLLTVNMFSNKEKFITGNRCEKGVGEDKKKQSPALYGKHPYAVKERLPNLYDYKYKRLFSYEPLPVEEAKRGVIGIPRVLNMYENYPFWFTLLTNLGFRVEISSPSSKELYEKGLDTIPSESVCYPSKLVHGHVIDLIEKGIKRIFYPSVFYEKREYKDMNDHYNCPIVISYAEVIKNNIDGIKEGVEFIAPFLSLDNEALLVDRIVEEFKNFKVTRKEVKAAIIEAIKERDAFKKDIQDRGRDVINYLNQYNKKGIVLCGKPYHLDPKINHGIPNLINSLDFAVLTEDSVSGITPLRNKLRVVDQWTYNARLYRAAQTVTEEPNLEFVQFNSFGCGLDAITSDQLNEILASGGKMYTMIKIDEGNNLGAVKIRIRSLKAAIEEREKHSYRPEKTKIEYKNPIFDSKRRKTDTILAPQMSPIHFELVEEAARASGYKMVILPDVDQEAVDAGIKYVNNDICYPAIIMIGQIIKALQSGEYDVNRTSVILTQTGGGCKATNYLSFLQLALKQAGFENVPLISLNAVGLGKQPGFVLSPKLINKLIMAILYGDLFMRVLYRTRPYEKIPGSSEKLYKRWNEKAKWILSHGNKKLYDWSIKMIIREFEALSIVETNRPKVAIVGEILAKYHPMANDNIVQSLEDGGAEVILPDLMDFFYYSLYNSDFKYKYLGGKKIKTYNAGVGLRYLDYYRKTIVKELGKSHRFTPPTPIDELANMVSDILSLGNHTGEGWLITAEMIEYLEQGINNILCVQPLTCLPNHITGRGMFKTLKEKYKDANIAAIDYDPGVSNVNQLNRIKLMLSVALENSKGG